MVFYEDSDAFIMMEQHRHARISGELAEQFVQDGFLQDPWRNDVIFGIHEHDRAWVAPDDAPMWNQHTNAPFSFQDYPLRPKLVFYEHGISEVTAERAYAGMICSLHYSSFFHPDESVFVREFLRREGTRQTLLTSEFESSARELPRTDFHLRLLQFCDDLSLFLCLQDPTQPPRTDTFGFVDGFRYLFDFTEGKRIRATWVDPSTARLNPWPFAGPFSLDIPTVRVAKDKARSLGIIEAFRTEDLCVRRVMLTP